MIRRFDIFLDRKTRPCLVVSPDEMNRHLGTILAVPMTTGGRAYPTRVSCRFRGKQGSIALDQIHAVDRNRLIRRLGRLGEAAQENVLATLAELFAR